MKSLIKNKKFIIGIASSLIIILIIGSILLFNNSNKKNIKKDVTSKYIAYVKINPSIKLEYIQTCKQNNNKISRCNEPKVTNYELVNDDAKEIYKNTDLLNNGNDLSKVLSLICDKAKENGIEFEKVDIYTDWDKINNYIDKKSNKIKFNIVVTNKKVIDTKIDADEKNIVTYDVTFDTNGGSNVDSQVIKKDEKVVKPSNPIKDGYKFIEWVLNNETFDFETIITEDITLKAKWEKDESVSSSDSHETTNNNEKTDNNKNEKSKHDNDKLKDNEQLNENYEDAKGSIDVCQENPNGEECLYEKMSSHFTSQNEGNSLYYDNKFLFKRDVKQLQRCYDQYSCALPWMVSYYTYDESNIKSLSRDAKKFILDNYTYIINNSIVSYIEGQYNDVISHDYVNKYNQYINEINGFLTTYAQYKDDPSFPENVSVCTSDNHCYNSYAYLSSEKDWYSEKLNEAQNDLNIITTANNNVKNLYNLLNN